MATAQTIINESLARKKDPHKTQWSDTELLSRLNKGVDYLHSVLIKHQIDWATTKITPTATPTVAGTELYNLPTGDFWGMVPGNGIDETGVWLDKTTSYAFLTPTEERESILYTGADSGQPSQYYLTATQIGLLPVPDAVYSLKYKYYTAPATLALDTAMPYSGMFNNALSSFMSSIALSDAGLIASGEMALYNELETTGLTLAARRTPGNKGFSVRRS